MKRSTAGGRRLPFRWMMAIGRTRPPIPIGTASSIRIPTSLATAGRGRMLTPAAMGDRLLDRLDVVELHHHLDADARLAEDAVDGAPDRRVVVEGDEPLTLKVGRLGQAAARQPVARVADQHHGSSRSGTTSRARFAGGYERIPRSASSPSTASTTL